MGAGAWAARGGLWSSEGALVWIGATLGIIASGALGGAIGRTIGARIPRHIARLGSSILFAAFGTVLIATNL